MEHLSDIVEIMEALISSSFDLSLTQRQLGWHPDHPDWPASRAAVSVGAAHDAVRLALVLLEHAAEALEGA